MKWCISQATTMSAGCTADIAAFADVEWSAVELWLTKVEKHLDSQPIDSLVQLLRDRQIAPAAASYQGGLLLSQGEQRKAHFDHFKRRLDLCQALGVPTLVLAPDYLPRPDSQAWQRAVVSLAQAAQWAAGFDVHLALEFRGVESFCTSLETAIAIVESCGEPNVGVCLDLFHFYKGPSKVDDLAGLTRANLAHVQLCDVAGVPRELMADSDRILPGDGDFNARPIVEHLKRIGYDRYVSVEVMSPVLWEMKLTQVAELARMALRRVVE